MDMSQIVSNQVLSYAMVTEDPVRWGRAMAAVLAITPPPPDPDPDVLNTHLENIRVLESHEETSPIGNRVWTSCIHLAQVWIPIAESRSTPEHVRAALIEGWAKEVKMQYLHIVVRQGKAFPDQKWRGYHARITPNGDVEVWFAAQNRWRADHALSPDQIKYVHAQAGKPYV